MDVPAAEGLDLDTQDFTATVSFENFDIAPPGAEVQFDLTWIDGTDFRKVASEMVKCCVGDPEGGILRTWSIPAAPGLDSDTLVPSGTFVMEKTEVMSLSPWKALGDGRTPVYPGRWTS